MELTRLTRWKRYQVIEATLPYIADQATAPPRRRHRCRLDHGLPGVGMIWNALSALLSATGRDGAISRYILDDFLGVGFDTYRQDVAKAEADSGLAATRRAVAYDSGEVLHTVYQGANGARRRRDHHDALVEGALPDDLPALPQPHQAALRPCSGPETLAAARHLPHAAALTEVPDRLHGSEAVLVEEGAS